MILPKRSTPFLDNYIAPIELAEHKATLALWPERNDVWREQARPIENLMISLVKEISKRETVYLGVSASRYEYVKNISFGNVIVYIADYDDIWVRDTGPIFVQNQNSVRGVDFEFNAWGGDEGLYKPWDNDNKLSSIICDYLEYEYYHCPLVLEGGGISFNGQGLGIATTDCIINDNRNPMLSKNCIEDILKNFLGIEKMIWLSLGYPDDETGGHVDNMCVFISPNELILAWSDDDEDEMFRVCRLVENEIIKQSKAHKIELTIHKLPIPKPIYATESERRGVVVHDDALKRTGGERLTASYVNSYFINGAVLVPKFNCPEDNIACDIFRKILKDREIIQIEARELLLGGGGFHCAFMQIPK